MESMMNKPEEVLRSSGVGARLEAMLGERFAQSYHFAEMNLEAIGKQIEELREMMDQPEAPAPLAMQKTSYENCVSLYCEVLMMLEDLRVPLPQEPLGALLSNGAEKAPKSAPQTSVEAAAPAPELASFEMPPIEPTPIGTPELSIASEDAVLGLDSPVAPAPVTPAPSGVSELSSSLSSTAAREHLELANYFEELKDAGTFPFSTHHINRLIDQSLCFCLEAECGDKFAPVLARFWPSREQAIRPLLDPTAKKVDLRAELKAEIDRLAAAHGEWLLDGRFPYASALTAIRYIVATQSAEKYAGSLLDYGLLLILFGQDTTVGSLQLRNWLGAGGLSDENRIEVAFRLSRLHKLRNKIVSATSRLSEQHRLTLQEDVHALLTTLSKLTFTPGSGLKEVA